MRIVLDTNVVLSALLWRGTPYRLFETVRRHDHIQLYSSVALLTELGQVLTRPMAQRRLALIGRTAPEVLADYADAVELVTPDVIPRVIAADPDDDQVVAAALAAGADFIVSGDHHLLTADKHGSIRVITPAEAIALTAAT